MTSKLGQCLYGSMKAEQRYNEPVNDSAVDKALGPDGQARFARESHYYDRDLSFTREFGINETLLENFSAYTGIDLRNLGAFFRDPSAILSENLVADVNRIYMDHLAVLKTQGLDPITLRRNFDEAIKKLPVKYQLRQNLDAAEAYFAGDRQALSRLKGITDRQDFLNKVRPAVENLGKAKQIWDATAKPQLEQIQLMAADTLDPIYADYLDKYFKFQIGGGQLYANKGAPSVLVQLARQAVGNLVAWNPMIATMNVFEYVPKATSYAMMNGQNPAVVIKAMSNLMRKTGGNPFARVSDWEARGIYGTGGPPNRWNYLEQSEGLLRNLSASLGEVMGQTPEMALEKVAFVNRLGNEMQPYWDLAGSEAVSLMRFSIASFKMYSNFFGQMAIGLKRGDIAQAGKAAGALAMFSVATAIQTGGTSAIPAPVAFILKKADPDTYEAIKEFDQEFPGLNLSKNLGLDIGEKLQPAAMPGFGIGYSVLTQDIGGGLKTLGTVPADLTEGKYGLAGARLMDGLLGVGQVTRLPGVTSTSKRLSKAMVLQLEDDAELNMEYFERAGETLGFIE